MTKTFYDVLGVSTDASTEDIRAAYRERLKESHPDLSDADDANETTRRIIRARDVLTDEDERERYDRLEHDEFVGKTDSGVDQDDVSDAAAAARRAGWANGDGDGSDPGESEDRSRASGRRRARERRRRERAARERVDSETTRERSHETTGQTPGETNEAGETTTDGGSTTATASNPGAARTSGGVSDTARSWKESGGYSVRKEYDTGFQRSRLIPTGKSLTLLAVAFVLYPLMLFSALFPPFPLVVNLVVGLCTIFLVGYLQSVPHVGVIVFGAWSIAVPVAFVVAGVPLTGLIGIVALAGTWLPLGLSSLTFSIVRP